MRFLFFIFLLSPFFCLAQLHIEGQYHKGYIIAHHQSMQRLVRGHTQAFSLTFFKKNTKDVSENPPETGFSAHIQSLGNPEELGAVYAFHFITKLALNKPKSITFTSGMGIGYITKKFNLRENGKNTAVASHLNASLYMALQWRILINKSVSINNGIRFQHYSNASFKAPNKGLNIPSLFLSLHFHNKLVKPDAVLKNENKTIPKKWHLYFGVGGGVKENLTPGGKKFGTPEMYGGLKKNLSHRFTMSIQGDVFYNNAIAHSLKQQDEKKLMGMNNFQTGISWNLFNTFIYGKRSFFGGIGIYIYSKMPDVGIIYNRLGYQHMVSNSLALRVSLKSHLSKADYVAIGLIWVNK